MKNQVTGSQRWLMRHEGINYSPRTSMGREASTNGSLHSKSWLKARDGNFSANTKLPDLWIW